MSEDTGSKGWSVSFCGLNCAKCDIHAAGHGNDKIRDEVVEWFRTERKKIIKPEQVTCEGCRGPLERHWSEDCRIMTCAKSKGVQYCFQCDGFPCAILNDFASDGTPHHKRTVENLERMRRIGLEAWISEQEGQGKCVFCP